MEYTEEQKRSFKAQFAVRRKRQMILAVPLVVVVLLIATLNDKSSNTIFGLPVTIVGPAFLVLVAAALFFSFRNWRCPACDRYLGKGISFQFCPKCGVPLQ